MCIRDSGTVGHRTQGCPQQSGAGSRRFDGGDFLCGRVCAGQVQIGRRRGLFLGGGSALPPGRDGGVVVGAGVDHTVLDMVVRQVLAVSYTHLARKAAVIFTCPGPSGDALLPGGLFVCPKGPILPKRLRSPGALRIMIDVLLCPKNV